MDPGHQPNDIDWSQVVQVSRPSEGSAALIVEFTNGGRVVVKGTMSVSSEIVGSMIMRACGCHVPKTRLVVWPSEEWGVMKAKLFQVTNDSPGLQGVVSALLNRTILLVQHWSSGVAMNKPVPLSDDGLRGLGKVVALDALLNNSDRLPCGSVWMNDGNPGNLLICDERRGSENTTNTTTTSSQQRGGYFVIPIDNATIPIPKPEIYGKKIEKFVADVYQTTTTSSTTTSGGGTRGGYPPSFVKGAQKRHTYAAKTLLWLRNWGLFDPKQHEFSDNNQSESRKVSHQAEEHQKKKHEDDILDEAVHELNEGFKDALASARAVLPSVASTLKQEFLLSKKLVDADWGNIWALAIQSIHPEFYEHLSNIIIIEGDSSISGVPPPTPSSSIDWWTLYRTWEIPQSVLEVMQSRRRRTESGAIDAQASTSFDDGPGSLRSLRKEEGEITTESDDSVFHLRVCLVQSSRMDAQTLRGILSEEQGNGTTPPHLVVFPEGSVYKGMTQGGPGEGLLNEVKQVASEYGVAVCCGSGTEEVQEDLDGIQKKKCYYETSLTVGSKGEELLRYRKRAHPGGNVKEVGKVAGVTSIDIESSIDNDPPVTVIVGVAICHDIEQSHIVDELFKAMDDQEKTCLNAGKRVAGKIVLNPSHIATLRDSSEQPQNKQMNWCNSHAAAARKLEHLSVEKGIYFLKVDQPEPVGAAMTQIVGPVGTEFIATRGQCDCLSMSLPLRIKAGVSQKVCPVSPFSESRFIFRSERENEIGKRYTVKSMELPGGYGIGSKTSFKFLRSNCFMRDTCCAQITPSIPGTPSTPLLFQSFNTVMLKEFSSTDLPRPARGWEVASSTDATLLPPPKDDSNDTSSRPPEGIAYSLLPSPAAVKKQGEEAHCLVLQRSHTGLNIAALELRRLGTTLASWSLPIELPRSANSFPSSVEGALTGAAANYHCSYFCAFSPPPLSSMGDDQEGGESSLSFVPAAAAAAALLTISPPAGSAAHTLEITYLIYLHPVVVEEGKKESAQASIQRCWMGFVPSSSIGGRVTLRSSQQDEIVDIDVFDPTSTANRSMAPSPWSVTVDSDHDELVLSFTPQNTSRSHDDASKDEGSKGMERRIPLPAAPKGFDVIPISCFDNFHLISTTSSSLKGAPLKGYPTICLLYEKKKSTTTKSKSVSSPTNWIVRIVEFQEGRSTTTPEQLFLHGDQ